MIISISGSVGSGKTSLSQVLGEKLNFEVLHLNEMAKEFKIEDVKDLETFDFDLDKLLEKLELKLKDYKKEGKNLIIEGHFAHFVNPDLVDILFIINRDLRELKKEYLRRGYNQRKISDNLEVESFNVCFYEAEEEGYLEGKLFCLDNCFELDDLVSKVLRKLKKFEVDE